MNGVRSHVCDCFICFVSLIPKCKCTIFHTIVVTPLRNTYYLWLLGSWRGGWRGGPSRKSMQQTHLARDTVLQIGYEYCICQYFSVPSLYTLLQKTEQQLTIGCVDVDAGAPLLLPSFNDPLVEHIVRIVPHDYTRVAVEPAGLQRRW